MSKIRIPYGYTLDHGNIVIDDLTGSIVREVFEKYCNGVYVAKLKEHIIGLEMNRHKINSLLSDIRYLGTDIFPRMISDEMFESVQKMKIDRLKSVGKENMYAAYKSKVIFHNKIICGECGNEFRIYKHGNVMQWECSNRKENGRINCPNLYISDEQLIQSFLRVVKKLKEQPYLLNTKRLGNKKIVYSDRYIAVDREIKKAESLAKVYEPEEMIRLIYRRATLLYGTSEIDDCTYFTKRMQDILSKADICQFDDEVFLKLTKNVMIYSNGKTKFMFYNRSETGDSIKM